MIGKLIKILISGVLIGAITVIVALAALQYVGTTIADEIGAWVGSYATQAPAAAAQTPAEVHTIDTNAVVVALAALNRWETQGAQVHACTTVDNAQVGKLWSFFTEEVKEVCADGVVIAGVDMHTFAGNVQTTAGTWVRVEAPASQVFAVTIDPQSYQVITAAGRKGWFAPERDDALWGQIHQNLTEGMLDAGCEQQITTRAADEFKTVAERLIRAIDPQITVVTVRVSAGDCKVVAPIDFGTEGK